jgi:hypothetical protein
MVERFPAAARGLNGDLDIFFYTLLPNVVGEALWAHACVNARVFIEHSA